MLLIFDTIYLLFFAVDNLFTFSMALFEQELDSPLGCKYMSDIHMLCASLLVSGIFVATIYIMVKHRLIDRCIRNDDGDYCH